VKAVVATQNESYDRAMMRWPSRLWDAYWDTRSWRDRDRVATVIAYAIPVIALFAFGWFWPTGTVVGEITFWTILFVLLGVCTWYSKRRARRRPTR
jgi:hypothetical protein